MFDQKDPECPLCLLDAGTDGRNGAAAGAGELGRGGEVCDRDALVARLERLRRAEAAVKAEILSVIAKLDEIKAYESDGSTDMASWLVKSHVLGVGSAKELVEVAGAMSQLPEVATAHGKGELSYDVAREVARFATPETQAEVVDEAKGWSVARATREAKRATDEGAEDARRAFENRSFKWWWSRSGAALHLSGAIPALDGAELISAIESFVAPPETKIPGAGTPYVARVADALVAMARASLGHDPVSPSWKLTIHTPLDAIVDRVGVGEVEDGVLAPEVVRRIACDARISHLVAGGSGEAMGIGRCSRNVPRWLSDAVFNRDRTCRFPGCSRIKGAEIHHIVHWADGGATDYDNLIVSCWFHHRLVHEGGWKMRGTANGALSYLSPDGRHHLADEVDPTRSARHRPRRKSGAGASKKQNKLERSADESQPVPIQAALE